LSKAAATEFLGLEVADREVRLALLTPGAGGHVVRYVCQELPPGAVDGGAIVQPDAAAAALRELLSAAATRTRTASLVLRGKRTVCCVEPLREGEAAEATAACEERMRRYVVFGGQPISIGHSIQAGQGRGDGAASLLSAAAPRELVLRQAALARRCGLEVQRVEPAMVVAARMLVDAAALPRPCFVLLPYEGGCEVGVLRPDGLVFCQSVAAGPGASAHDADALLSTLEHLQDYHLRHARGSGLIEEMVWCGPGAELEHHMARVEQAGVRCRWLDPAELACIRRLEGPGTDRVAQRASMAAAVAAALGAVGGSGRVGRIDLLPPPEGKRGLRLLPPWLLVPTALALLAALALVGAERLVRRKTAAVMYALDHPTPRMLECSRLQVRETQARRGCEDIELLLACTPRHDAPAFVAELPRRLPREVWLDRLQVGPGAKCLVEGTTQVTDAVFALGEALRKSPYVESVRVTESGGYQDGGVILTRFTLEVVLASLDRPQEARQ